MKALLCEKSTVSLHFLQAVVVLYVLLCFKSYLIWSSNLAKENQMVKNLTSI